MEKYEKTLFDILDFPVEQDWFEFKENWFEPVELGHYVSALSNAAAMGGRSFAYLVWGVQDGTRRVVGTSFDWTCNVKGEPLEHFLARQLTPDTLFSFHDLSYEGKRVVLLEVAAARKIPTSFAGVRSMRIGSSKVNLARYPEREAELFQILHEGVPTLVNTESEYQKLSFNKLLVYYMGKGVTLNPRAFKKNLRFLTRDGKYNLLAQLLSDDSHIAIRLGMFTGKDKTSTMYAVRELGNTCLLYSLDKMLEYCELINIPQADERNRVVERNEVPLFNAEACKEAVINAFVHNLWVTQIPPMFSLFSDRLEILSHGGIPKGQTREGFLAGESLPVNKELSDIFLQLHISERTGRGVPRIVSTYGEQAYTFRENSVIATIPFEHLKIYGDARGEQTAPQDAGKAPQDTEKAPQDTEKALQDTEKAPQDAGKNDTRRREKRHKTAGKTTQDSEKTTQDAEKTTQDAEKTTQDAGKTTQDAGKTTQVRLSARQQKQRRILDFCMTPKTLHEISEMLEIKGRRNIWGNVKSLLEDGHLAMTMPDRPTSRFQKYVTIR